MISEALFYFGFAFAPLAVYLSLMLFWAIPERICPRSFPSKPICTILSCNRCPKNLQLLNRAKTFVDGALLFPPPIIRDAIRDSLKDNERLLFRMPGLNCHPIWNQNQWESQLAADVKKLEDNRATIKLACLQVLKNASLWHQKSSPSGGTWFIYSLLKEGSWCDKNCDLEPDLMEVIHSLKLTMHKCAFGNIYFSLLPPQTRIESHTGPTNIRLKCHLALEVPADKDSCFLMVNNEKVFWDEGKCLIFDDSLPHSIISNATKEDRIALILDFWHPSLSYSSRVSIRRAFPQTE